MSIKLAKSTTIWRFLSDLRTYVIEPSKIDVLQLDEGIRIRRNIKVHNVVAARQVANQEDRLTRGEITPIQFLHFMAHKVRATSTEPDLEQLADDAELEAELAELGEEEELDDEVFDEG
jgi:hypothetical protein